MKKKTKEKKTKSLIRISLYTFTILRVWFSSTGVIAKKNKEKKGKSDCQNMKQRFFHVGGETEPIE